MKHVSCTTKKECEGCEIVELGQVRSIDNEHGLQILSSFAIINFKRHHSSPFTYLSVLAFQSCFASVFYHISVVCREDVCIV